MRKLSIVGIGAGDYDGMTIGAVNVLNESEVIVGYTVYCDLIRPYFKDKVFVSTPMTTETERCRLALESAREGKTTSMICSGDAGVYGMASPVLEMAEGLDIEINVVPGVTAACSGAAVLGSPLTGDFAVISLSDLLTPMEKIEKRLECAAEGDFCIAIYNPSSAKRKDHLRKACEIIMRHRSPQTVCGIARNIGREGEKTEILTLAELAEKETDMFCTVFIGNSSTKLIDGRMVTPRGYRYE